jgi:hypothetical protein
MPAAAGIVLSAREYAELPKQRLLFVPPYCAGAMAQSRASRSDTG